MIRPVDPRAFEPRNLEHPLADTDSQDEPFRALRADSLRELLDEEFARNYRFEGLADFFNDIKGLLRKVVGRSESDEELGEFIAGERRNRE